MILAIGETSLYRSNEVPRIHCCKIQLKTSEEAYRHRWHAGITVKLCYRNFFHIPVVQANRFRKTPRHDSWQTHDDFKGDQVSFVNIVTMFRTPTCSFDVIFTTASHPSGIFILTRISQFQVATVHAAVQFLFYSRTKTENITINKDNSFTTGWYVACGSIVRHDRTLVFVPFWRFFRVVFCDRRRKLSTYAAAVAAAASREALHQQRRQRVQLSL